MGLLFFSFVTTADKGHSQSLLKLLLFSEKHGETDDGAVDEEAADYGHDHGWDLDEGAVCEDDWES